MVVVIYVGNDEKVVVFIVEIGIKIYKWNVVDYEVFVVGIVQVEVDFGLIDIVVVNVGIICDVLFYKMMFDMWNDVININLIGVFNMIYFVWSGMCECKFGCIVVIFLING